MREFPFQFLFDIDIIALPKVPKINDDIPLSLL